MTTDTGVLDTVAVLIERVLDRDGAAAEITRETSFQDDLEFESIDIVVLGTQLADRYGAAINFPRYLSTLEIDDIIGLRVGDLVDYVESCVDGP
ncbi:phosphopantetheine-binding protein [Actinokineospora sp. NBRC 105648]|uniref:acyl carrier protein n=1 Tax=Actinokineospora sp. NBRC 105648 TaxID=3032206 RepID=UPI0024A07E5B|nr:phosphopantetheine-binding protein [Actinokineospora sp. NBRC 105648]GLZ40428.1 hypothetical protein Acsp05_40520 [Actinokineospora sp. NBRC 105648]